MKKPSVRDMLIGAGIASILNDGGDEPKTTRSKRGCLGCFGLLVILGLVGYGLEKLGCIPDRDDEEETVTTRNETAEPRDKDGRLIAEKMAVLEKKMAEYWRKTNAELEIQEIKLRAKYKAETEAANLEWRKRCEEREAIRLIGLSPEEYERRKKLYDEAVAREREAGSKWSHLSNGVEFQEKLIHLRNEARAKANAYREKLEKDLASDAADTQEAHDFPDTIKYSFLSTFKSFHENMTHQSSLACCRFAAVSLDYAYPMSH
jgi:hypothetical protein